jgi:cell division protein FtsW (lipid II flippase)
MMPKKNSISIFYFLGPIIATISGMMTVKSYAMPISLFYPNLAAIILGILISLWIMFKWHEVKFTQIKVMSIISVVLLLSSFLFPGQINVHRWISISSFNLNISMIVLPVILFGLNYLLQSKYFLYAIILFLITGISLTYQPDAGQATSFVLAALVLFAINKSNIPLFLGVFFTAAIIIAMSWLRVDLLEPVEYVEEILYMIRSFGPIGYLAILVTAVFSFYPFISIMIMLRNKNRALAIAFIVYLLSTFVVTEFGHYPVPLMGAGASPVIGWYLMLAFCSKQFLGIL